MSALRVASPSSLPSSRRSGPGRAVPFEGRFGTGPAGWRASRGRTGVHPERVEAVLAAVAAVGLDAALVAAAGAVPPATRRTLDAIHLATAALLGEDLEAVVTYDRRLAEADEAAGLPAASPGS